MVARFDTNPSIRQTLNYNEQKVKRGVAEFLGAENYPIDNQLLNFYHKLNRLENQAALNANVTRNSVHISLNFDPSERMDKEKLMTIANTYMDKIGFGEQPYLVYQHFDAGHPHIHIVSVKVRPDGKRIDTQNIGRNQSEKARKEIEILFGLVKAEDSKLKEQYRLQPINAQKVQYGKTETKQAISNVLKTVLNSYKYTTLHELNALLSLYNVVADRGSEQSNIYRNNGLTYRVLDAEGKKVGTPIKASQFFMKPTLKKLEDNFKKNESLKNPLRSRVKNMIDLSFLKNPKQSLDKLIKALEREGIATVLRQNDAGRIYGITYIDHKAKVIFNGSDLGKQYSANAIQERCGMSIHAPGKLSLNPKDNQSQLSPDEPLLTTSGTDLLNTLLQQEYTGDTMPFELKRNKKRKRKRLSNNQ